MTAQAPHSPVLQQSLLPFISRVSRRNSNSDVEASAVAVTDWPLIFVLMVMLIIRSPCPQRLSKSAPNPCASTPRRSSDGILRCFFDHRLGLIPRRRAPQLPGPEMQ